MKAMFAVFNQNKTIHCTKNKEILNGNLHSLCSDFCVKVPYCQKPDIREVHVVLVA